MKMGGTVHFVQDNNLYFYCCNLLLHIYYFDLCYAFEDINIVDE